MSDWYSGESRIDCDLDRVRRAFDDPGALFVGVVGLMPGMTSVELVAQQPDAVTIRTNEGLMERTGITQAGDADAVVVEFDERYRAGSRVAVTSHFREEFTVEDDGIRHRTVISGVEAPGVIGFLYRNFGRASIGKAVQASYRAYFEQPR